MTTSIQAQLGRTAPSAQTLDTPDRIELLMKAMGTVRKQLRELYKQLGETADPAERMVLIKRIDALKEMLHAMQEQLILLTQMEARRKHMRAVSSAPSEEEDPPAPPPSTP